ncbi:hypothetical protein [Psychromonas sp. Urea-02u-13]|uniref:hypothetical protein n=1 Tax=Psychromonas sp. Urea-02u-13 TaxID=2058326 RepID=UPI000C31CD4D|nr:hypothetical protein [Psychromonas sp. Urea-02u-13]PKG37795.1 hypothetical protein CXF74_16955 [Psychromonas sp. Urea-02u-13]
MRFLKKNNKKRQSRSNQYLCFVFCFLCSIPSPTIAKESEATVMSNEAMKEFKDLKTLMTTQIEEWNEMKPALKRLIRSEQDLALIIGALEKSSPLPSQPTEKQLLEPNRLTLPAKQKIKNRQVTEVKRQPAIIKRTTTEKVDKSSPSVKKREPVKENKSPKSVNATTQIGIHLASYKKIKNVEPGWQVLKSQFSGQFRGKIPFYYQTEVGNVLYTRLVVGSFRSTSIAKKVCMALEEQGQYCQVLNYQVVAKKG